MTTSSALPAQTSTSEFTFSRLTTPAELRACYRLRYEVYCNQSGLLDAADYPDDIEQDAYDKDSIHLGAWNPKGDLVGTLRLVRSAQLVLPLFAHCDYKSLDFPVLCNPESIAEISRLCVSKVLTRHPRPDADDAEKLAVRARNRAAGPEVVAGIVRLMYAESKREGLQHWVVAMERSLFRLLKRIEVYFNTAGAPFEYYGEVVPYRLSVADFEARITQSESPVARAYLDALPAHLRPKRPSTDGASALRARAGA
jgi:N-acyl amino acid synthase of PEP-CTERM/exosortase system